MNCVTVGRQTHSVPDSVSAAIISMHAWPYLFEDITCVCPSVTVLSSVYILEIKEESKTKAILSNAGNTEQKLY